MNFYSRLRKKDTWHTKILDESKLHGNKLLQFNVFFLIMVYGVMEYQKSADNLKFQIVGKAKI